MKQFIRSLGFAINGLRVAVAGQRHMKFHLGAAMLVAAAGIYCNLTSGEWGLVFLAIGLVMSAELMNSAVEGLVDLIEPTRNQQAGRIKDIAAGGVLIASLSAFVIGLLVFHKYIFS